MWLSFLSSCAPLAQKAKICIHIFSQAFGGYMAGELIAGDMRLLDLLI